MDDLGPRGIRVVISFHLTLVANLACLGTPSVPKKARMAARHQSHAELDMQPGINSYPTTALSPGQPDIGVFRIAIMTPDILRWHKSWRNTTQKPFTATNQAT